MTRPPLGSLENVEGQSDTRVSRCAYGTFADSTKPGLLLSSALHESLSLFLQILLKSYPSPSWGHSHSTHKRRPVALNWQYDKRESILITFLPV